MVLIYLLFGKLRQIRNFLPIALPKRLRSIILDFIDSLSKPQNQIIAPLKLRHTLGQAQEVDGEWQVHSLRDLCKLQPNESVLDVGSGCGRIALSLAKYLNRNGSYEGLEIVKDFVDWCQSNISPRYPNFNFTHADIYNSSYNPNGRFKASQYKFPYKDKSFDVVVLSSVFTHMLPRDLENYISEINRVLKDDGRCWISYFLVDRESQRFANGEHTQVNFINMGEYFVVDPKVPESAVGYREEYILKLYDRNELDILYPIHYGSGGQDLIVARKRAFKSA
jgi:SAM-dependent methyltransferase